MKLGSLFFLFEKFQVGKWRKTMHTCEFCKKKYEVVHKGINDSSILTLSIGDEGKMKYISKFMCPECTEKLLELLDKHFPRLNLEDEL